MDDWTKPDGLIGNETFVRVQSWHTRRIHRKCPQRMAIDVRPGISREDGVLASGVDAPASALGAVNSVLDSIEFDQLTETVALRRWQERTQSAPALVKWTIHAVRQVLSANAAITASLSGQFAPAPVSRAWARQRSDDAGVYEETVTGRRYESDGMRELHLLRTGSVEATVSDEDDDTEVAFVAGVLAGASPVLGGRWDKHTAPFRLGRFESPNRVRVVEIGCLDGSFRIRFDGTRHEALRYYEKKVGVSLSEIAAGGGLRPGNDCAGCALVDTCPAVPRVPGLLNVAGGPRRSWSISSGRDHDRCPARSRLAAMFLPRERAAEDNEATRRGRAVHDWIERCHRHVPPRACRPDADPAESWGSSWAEPDPLEARLAVQMVGDHALVCPLRDPANRGEVLVEWPIVAFDPEANAVVVAKADLLYRDADGWVLRETKTSRWPKSGDLLKEYPQLALAVLLSSAGVLAHQGTALRVELEQLTGTGPIVTEVDATDAAALVRARRVVTGLAEPLFTDTELRARPGKACLDCPFTRWCPDTRRQAS